MILNYKGWIPIVRFWYVDPAMRFSLSTPDDCDTEEELNSNNPVCAALRDVLCVSLRDAAASSGNAAGGVLVQCGSMRIQVEGRRLAHSSYEIAEPRERSHTSMARNFSFGTWRKIFKNRGWVGWVAISETPIHP